MSSNSDNNPIVAALAGIFLFFGSFVVLYINEGEHRAAEALKNATIIHSGETTVDGIIAHTGTATAVVPVGGDNVFISGGNFLSLKRDVEIYAWEERKSGKTNKESNYSYSEEWVSFPSKTSDFKEREGHENKDKMIKDFRRFAEGIRVGGYALEISQEKPDIHIYEPLDITQVAVLSGQTGREKVSVNDNRLFISREGGSIHNIPAVGDHRISYSTVPLNTEITFVGALRNKKLIQSDGEMHVFDVYLGDFDTALQTAKKEDSSKKWHGRIGGFIMMLFGLFLVASLPTILFDFIPFGGILGGLSRMLIFAIAVPITLALSAVTIIISTLIHNPIVLIPLIGLLLIVSIVTYCIKKDK